MSFLARCAALTLLSFNLNLVALSQQQRSDAEVVKEEFLHAWNAYKTYAWGHDDVKPLSKQPHNWYGTSLLMTPVDAFDTMVLMKLEEEAGETRKLILDNLSFDKDIEVQSFEITIRLLGGLLSAYQMDGDRRFLALAEDLGKRLLPVFNSATGMPYRYVHLQTGRIRDSLNNPAEIGTCLLEFGMLSKLTGDSVYYDKAKNALVQLFNRRSTIGLVGSLINVETGEWVRTTSHIAGGIDSYYEYLLKAAILFDDDECRTMWEESLRSVNDHLADTTRGGLWYRQVDMHTGKEVGTTFGSLDAFFPAVLALGGEMEWAAELQQSSFTMWNLHGIEPERMDYAKMEVTRPQYYLRPEIIESAYYLYSYTQEQKYKEMGSTFLKGLMEHCRTDAGYAFLEDVRTKQQGDGMESFFLAETLKYLFLLADSPGSFRLDDVVFNTEAHPFRKTW